MKVFAKYSNDWIVIPCSIQTWKIKDLKNEVMIRYSRMSGETVGNPDMYQVRKSSNGALLDPSDEIRAVLSDEDYVLVVAKDAPTIEIGLPEVNQKMKSLQLISKPTSILYMDGSSLRPGDLMKIKYGSHKIMLTESSWSAVEASRQTVDTLVKENSIIYGVTTGIGQLSNCVIEKDKLQEFQENIIRSTAAGVGKPLPLHQIRTIFALRINVLAKGYSGISRNTLEKYIEAFNASCLPYVPEQGSVGASGDLAPLAHIALGLIGEGEMWSPKTGWTGALLALEANGLTPLNLQTKEGVTLINGTQLTTALGAEAVERAVSLCRQADVVASLTMEVLKGSVKYFKSEVHAIRPHPGQNVVAKRLRSLLDNGLYKSEIAHSHRFCNKVQDAYTLRCCPQVHGVVNDTVRFVHDVICTEMNSATDNPLVFSDQKEIISAGNFHGEYPAKMLDYLAIAIHELSSISERRIERLVNPALSELPAFLVKEGGLNSGFMMTHVTAAALVSENKTLCHPSSVDSLPTSAGQEDHVSMGPWAARKCLKVIENVENVLAIELLCATQALDLLRPLKSTEPLEAVHGLVRTVVPFLEKDRYMSPDIEAVRHLISGDKVWTIVQPYIQEFDLTETAERDMTAERNTELSYPSV